MAQSSAVFLTAVEARQNILKDTIIHEEKYGIESAILDAIKLGFYEVTVSDGTPMTNSSSVISDVWTVDPETDQLNVPNHGFSTGDVVIFSSTISLPSPLVSGSYYYVIYVDADHIKVATSYTNAMTGKPVGIDITAGVNSIILGNPGSGYIQPPIVTITGGGATVSASARAQLAGYGGLVSVALTTTGTGYNDQPSVEIVATGSGAVAGNITYSVVGIGISNSGNNYRIGDILSVTGGTGTAATAVVQEVNGAGSITSLRLSNSGEYLSIPALSGAGTTVMPGGGINATVNLTIGIKNVEISNGGSGYVSPPRVLITDITGTGAIVTSNVTGGSVTSVSVANPGYGYTGSATAEFTSGSGATAIASLAPTSVASVTLTDSGGNTYTSPPAVVISTVGLGCSANNVQMKVINAQMTGPGTGYLADDILLISGGVAIENGWIRVISVNLAGQIIGYRLENGGKYTDLPNLQSNPVIGGSGRSATFNLSMGVESIDVGNSGSGYQVPPEVYIDSPGSAGIGATAVAKIQSGGVSSFLMTSSGSGYTSVPLVTVSNGAGATAEAILTGTTVDEIIVSLTGSGYTYANVEISGGDPATPATATAVIEGGQVTRIDLISPGTGYTSAPDVIITGDGSNATAVANLVPTSISAIIMVNNGTGYNHVPVVNINGAGTADAIIQATGISRIEVSNQGSNYTSDPTVYLIPGPNQTGTPLSPTMVAQRGYSLAGISVTSGGSGYQSAPSVAISPPQIANGTQATATAYIGTGAGTFGVRPYFASRDYFKAWNNQPLSNNQLSRPYLDQMNLIITYFTNLGYTINRITNPSTNATISWKVQW